MMDPALSPTPVCSEDISGVTLSVDPGPPNASVAADTYIIRSIGFLGLAAGPGNTGPGSNKSASAIFNDEYINTTAGPLNAVYVIAPVSVPVAGVGCVGPNMSVTLTINPAPKLVVTNAITCNGQTSDILFDVDPSGAPVGDYNLISVVVQAGLTADPGNRVPTNGVTNNFVENDRFTNALFATQTVTYRVRPVASGTLCQGPEESIVLTVEPLIVAQPDPLTSNICGDGIIGTSVELESPSIPSAGPITFEYQAVASTPGQIIGFAPVANSLPNNHIVQDHIVNNTNTVGTVTYTVIPRAPGAKNGQICSGNPIDFVVNVEPKPKLTIPATKVICEDDAVNIDLISPTVPSSGTVTFDMTSAVTGGTITGASASGSFNNGQKLMDILSNSLPTNGSVEYTFTPRAGSCVGSDVTTVVSVTPRPNFVAPIIDFNTCSGVPIASQAINVDTNTATTIVTWTASPAAGVTGAAGGTGFAFQQVLFNSTRDPQIVTYTMTARNGSCAGAPDPLVVTVYPTPRMTAMPTMNVCNNGSISLPLTSSANNATYTWTTTPSSTDLPAIGGSGGVTINQTFVNPTDALGNYQYTITPTVVMPSGGQCDGIESFMIVNVAPPVLGQLYSSDNDNSAFVCKGARDFMFFEFGGLPLFEYTYSDGTTTKTVAGKGPIDIVTVSPAVTTTYTLLSVKDAYGCIQNPAGQAVTINVGVTDATFSIDGPAIACSPYQVKFKHDQVAGVNYTWKWFDGVADSTYLASTSVAGQLVPHTFFNPSPGGNVPYKVFLESTLDANYPGGCLKTTFQEVKVYPTVSPAVFPDKDVICSDESVTFVNSSQGVASQKWFYRVAGSTTELDAKTTRNVTFTMPNTSSSNPIVYEVVYQSTNGNCPASDVIMPITVYRGVDAHFSNTVPTVFVGGHSSVTFTNDSAPVDGDDFKYAWEFGLNANPETTEGVGPFVLDYTTPGPKEIVLVATNVAAAAAGLSCADEYRQIISIIVPPLIAEFTAIPLEACFPTDITVTENKATGDKFAWRVIDNAGTAAQSNAELPVFKVPAPGKYTIELVTSNSFTGDQKTATQDVIIYNLPMASFDMRPGVVYVPDTELTTYNFSDGATSYLWDFDDGTTSDEKEPVHKYRIEGVYDVMLIAMNDHGNNVVCTDTLTRKLTAKQGGVTRVPNAFTPNPNGPTSSVGTPGIPGSNTFNDVFLPQVKGSEEFNMQVFDRWGNLVFESNNANVGWDGYDRNGKLMPAGVYVFKLTLRLSDGQRTTQVGDITMIR
jgi:gliding motility-associated-like protein